MRSLLRLLFGLLTLPLFAGDLTVGWISRQPEIAYVWNSSNPAIEGWPAIGEPVTWRAHVRSWMDAPVTIEYRWLLDDVELARGTKAIAANATTLIDVERPWSFRRERLKIEIDLTNAASEESETNNALEVFTDALSVGMWVEQSVYDWFRAHQQNLKVGSTSWENWAQRHIELYNDLAAMAVYPETPRGVLDRWRLQKIVIVPDNALPLVKPPDYLARDGEPNGMTHPDMSDRTVDLQIGLRASVLRSYQQTGGATFTNPFYLHAVMLHELGHARYLTDVYAFDLVPKPGKVIEVGAELPYHTPEHGLMNTHFTFIDRYSAIALNRIAGRRAILGNYNEPENFSSFLNDLPAANRLVIRDAAGQPIPHAKVEIFQSEPFRYDEWYAMHYDDVPDLTFESDAAGRVEVGRNPFGGDRVVHYWRGSNAVAIVRVTKNDAIQWGFLEVRQFNLAWWRGQVEVAEHDLYVGRRNCARELTLSSPGWEASLTSNEMTARWLAVSGATEYRVYAARAGGAPRLVATTKALEATVPVNGTSYWWVEADLANCPGVRSASSKVHAPVAPAVKRRRAA